MHVPIQGGEGGKDGGGKLNENEKQQNGRDVNANSILLYDFYLEIIRIKLFNLN